MSQNKFYGVMEERSIVMIHGSLGDKGFKQRVNAKERRLFMSPRVSDTLRRAAPQRASRNDNDRKFQEQEFMKIYKEVEQLGSSQLSWKQRKALEAKKILSLDGKPEKRHKMPIDMGRNIKRKREKFEEQKLKEEMALGLRTVKKGKKGTEKKSATNRSLKTSDGIFKGGVLYVKPIVMKEAKREVYKGILPGVEKKSKRKIVKKGKHKGRKKRQR